MMHALRSAEEAANAVPDSGQFASTRPTSALMEYNACREAMEWLRREKGWPQPIAATQPDPPDVIFEFADGKQVGLEFTRVVHAKTIEFIKHRRSLGDGQEYYQDWTSENFRKQLDSIVRKKEKKFERHLTNGRCFRPLVLVLGSDGVASGEHLVANYQIASDVFSEILVHFGYPGNSHNTGSATDPVVFPSLFDIRAR